MVIPHWNAAPSQPLFPPHSQSPAPRQPSRRTTNGSTSYGSPRRRRSYRFAPTQETDGTRTSLSSIRATKHVPLDVRDEGTFPETEPAETHQENPQTETCPR